MFRSFVPSFPHHTWYFLPDVTWASWRLKLPPTPPFVQLFHQADNNENTLLTLCEGNPPVTGGFPSQMASDVDSVSMPWRHHVSLVPYTWYLPAETSLSRLLTQRHVASAMRLKPLLLNQVRLCGLRGFIAVQAKVLLWKQASDFAGDYGGLRYYL